MDRQSQWWAAYKHAVPPGYQRFLEAESEATTIFIFNYLVMPGLLQIEPYASCVTHQFSAVLSQQAIKQAVRLRMERQWRIFERRPRPNICAVIDESVLQRNVGGSQVQQAQLAHLAHLIEEHIVTLQVLPLKNGCLWPLLGCLPFVIFDTPSGSLLSMESATMNDHLNVESAFQISHFRSAFDDLSCQALDPAQSLKLINSLYRQP